MRSREDAGAELMVPIFSSSNNVTLVHCAAKKERMNME